MSRPMITEPVTCAYCGDVLEIRRGRIYIEVRHGLTSGYLPVEVRALGDGDFMAGVVRIGQAALEPVAHRTLFRPFTEELSRDSQVVLLAQEEYARLRGRFKGPR